MLEDPLDLEALGAANKLKLALFTDTYVPNRDTDTVYSGLSGELANGNGYTTAGATLASVATSYDASSDQVRLDFADVSWTFTAAKTWRYGVIYETDTSKLLGLLSWDSNQTVSTAYSIVLDSAGLLFIDVT